MQQIAGLHQNPLQGALQTSSWIKERAGREERGGENLPPLDFLSGYATENNFITAQI